MLLSWVASCGTEILAMTSGDDDKFAALNDACDVIPGPGGPGSVTDLFIARGGRFRVSGVCASRLMGRSQTAVSGKRRRDRRKKKKGRTNGLDFKNMSYLIGRHGLGKWDVLIGCSAA
jgi:hypothetical protein